MSLSLVLLKSNYAVDDDDAVFVVALVFTLLNRLVIECQSQLNWYEIFGDNCTLSDGSKIHVEQAVWDDIIPVSYHDSGNLNDDNDEHNDDNDNIDYNSYSTPLTD